MNDYLRSKKRGAQRNRHRILNKKIKKIIEKIKKLYFHHIT